MTMDYAERLPCSMNNQIQTEYYGNGRSLSIEGTVVEFHLQEDINKVNSGLATIDEINTVMESHSHFSYESRQDASTTFQHLEMVI